MNNFSPNMLKTFELCPYRFFLKYIEKITLPQSSKPFEKGKNIHALASYYLGGFDVQKFENVLSTDEKMTWKMLKSNEYFKLTPVKIEYQISTKIGKYWVGGRLDALVKDDLGNFYILDYKTGAIPKNPQQDWQSVIYLLGISKFLHGENLSYNALKFIYIDLKNNKNEVIEFNSELKKMYQEKVILICQKIQAGIFGKIEGRFEDTKGQNLCEFARICNGCNK